MKVYICYCMQPESPFSNLGFGPFELVFGHTVRGPLNLLKEQ